MKYFLRIGMDYTEDAQPYRTLGQAKAAYYEVAEELDRYGQSIDASIHIADNIDGVAEYPDYVLSYKNNRVITERA